MNDFKPFGSAMTNFGVRPFLDAFLELAQRPIGRSSSDGMIDPLREDFSGFVFKLQANMDPRHRDRVSTTPAAASGHSTPKWNIPPSVPSSHDQPRSRS
jgi:peptide subunit release factor RF-3